MVSFEMNVTLPKQLEEFVAEQVRGGGFRNKDEVIRAAVRQMLEFERSREMEAFTSAFREVDKHAPDAGPTRENLAEIDRIVKSVRNARKQRRAA